MGILTYSEVRKTEFPVLWEQGRVSILAHSLGTVLSYDVLCNQPHLFAALEVNEGAPSPPPHPPAAKRPRPSTANGKQRPLRPFTSSDLDASQVPSHAAFPLPVSRPPRRLV
jgi:hypothetical protein